jgi:4-hydroxy-tetrahydrodipicolinate synthase
LAMTGKAEEARALNKRLAPLHQALFLESNPIPVKWALARKGRIGDHLRLPMTELAPAYHEQLLAAMQSLDLV